MADVLRLAAYVWIGAGAIASSACASATVIPVRGAIADLSALAGE